MSVLVVIPARYGSTRFPGKPLALLKGKSIIQRTWEQASKAGIGDVVVATDDDRIFQHVIQFGGEAVLTSATCVNGTQRCSETIENLAKKGHNYEYLVNVQGDEPLLAPESLQVLANLITGKQLPQIATLATLIQDRSDIASPHVVKVVCNRKDHALYFSRAAIPFNREGHHNCSYFQHLGIYAYKSDILKEIVNLPASPLEEAEQLEQLRWLENGYTIQVGLVTESSIGIDTPEDLKRAEYFV